MEKSKEKGTLPVEIITVYSYLVRKYSLKEEVNFRVKKNFLFKTLKKEN